MTSITEHFIHLLDISAKISEFEAQQARVSDTPSITSSEQSLANRRVDVGGNMFDDRFRLMFATATMSIHHRLLNLYVLMLQTIARQIHMQLDSLK